MTREKEKYGFFFFFPTHYKNGLNKTLSFMTHTAYSALTVCLGDVKRPLFILDPNRVCSEKHAITE